MATQITATTELQAINTMLSAIGEAPVNTIEGTVSVDVSVAKNILDETSLSVQAEGHNFNTHIKSTVSKDTDNKIPLPVNCVQADASNDFRHMNLVIRDGFLYDMENDTDVFSSSTVPTLDLVLVQQFEHLPEYARRYITVKAARRFASRFIGDAGLAQLIQFDEQEALNQFKQADSRSADLNILKGDANTFSIIDRQPRRRY
tara:strand:- start:1297 stop:1905 length:609 start_codon:yes stop_codon:yes gene_type:complete